MNESALNEYTKQQNYLANLVDYLMEFTTNLLISTSTSIRLQASSLVQLTKSTNQLTRSATVMNDFSVIDCQKIVSMKIDNCIRSMLSISSIVILNVNENSI